MAEDRMQHQRFELKYLVSEKIAAGIRAYVSSYLELDEFAAGKPNNSYPVHSLYLDTDDLRLYWGTINGTKNRFKLRLRFYNESSPIFFEIKRRLNYCILKQRAAVKREHVQDVLEGNISPEFFIKKDSKTLQAAQNFFYLTKTMQARPKVHISYLREAWVTPENNSIRLTLDRDVSAERELVPKLKPDRRRSTQTMLARHVILELKFTGRYPYWFRELVQVFGLMQSGAAKYCEGVVALGENKMISSGAVFRDQPLPMIDNWDFTPVDVSPLDLNQLRNR
ncbi:MAG: VTC domain-containing protein [Limisphaerales bacterium]|jgi:SPX domain protein involved in polyphosphate accumulation|nr:polyphosphate polymerase domain-containing protein [Verrucomicrobiota bacterium]